MLLGGAALTRTYVERDLREVYDGRLFYGKDAFEGLHTMDQLMEGKKSRRARPRLRPRPRAGACCRPASRRWRPSERSPPPRCAPTSPPTSRSSRRRSSARASPRASSLDEIASYINETALFRNQWQFRPDKSLGENDADFKERIRPTLRARARRGQGRGLAGARRDLGLLPGQRRRQRPHRLDRRRPPQRAPAVHLPAPAQRPSPLHLRLLPQRRVGRRRLRGVPRGHRRRARQRARARAVRRRPLPGVPPHATASRSR